MVTLEFAFPPSTNKLWGYGNGRVFADKNYKKWKANAGWAVIEARRQGKPCHVAGRFTATIVLDKRRRRWNVDCDNRAKGVLDLLQSMLVIENDALADRVEIKWGEANGVRVTITPSGNYSPREDFERSLEECYRAIKARKAAGGPGWPS